MSDARRPDDVISPGGRTPVLRRLGLEAVVAVPNLIRLVRDLLGDSRVPRRSKVALGAAIAYVVSPVDLIPEVIPVAGVADDLLVLCFAINHLVSVAGEEVVLEHWRGSRDVLDLVRSVLDMASDLVPNRIRRLFRSVAG